MRINYILLIFLSRQAVAQEAPQKEDNQIRPEKFSLALSVKADFGILSSGDYKDFNGNENAVDLLAGYNNLFNTASENQFRLNLGVSYHEFSAVKRAQKV